MGIAKPIDIGLSGFAPAAIFGFFHSGYALLPKSKNRMNLSR